MTTTPTASPELPDLDRLQFRKKPVVIEAMQWDGNQFVGSPPDWIGDAINQRPGAEGSIIRIGDEVRIATLEGDMATKPGDWIIRGVKGELYPCKPDIFAATYEPAARRAQPEGEAPQADAAVMVPKFEGQFDSHQDWVNRAQRVLSVPSHKPSAICVDAKGRRCHIGADMKRASEEGTFPVRYFWECELATPAATLSPLCGAQHAESGKEVGFEIEPFPDLMVLTDVPYAMNTPEDWEPEYRDNWQALQVAEANKRELRAYARRLRAALAAQQAAAPGYKFVPIEPTPKMQQAGHDTPGAHMYNASYRAMVAAAPGNSVEFDGIKTSAPGTPEAPQTAAARDVLAERQRQVEQEGWTPAHDDAYVDGQLASAAVAYAQAYTPYLVPSSWPWAVEWFKAGNDRRNMVKAGALILAEIERLDRAAQLDGGQGEGQ